MTRLALITLLLVGTLQAQQGTSITLGPVDITHGAEQASGKGVVTLQPPPNCSTDPGVIRPCDNSDKALELTDQLMQLVRNQQETIKTLIDNAADMNRHIIDLEQRLTILEQKETSK